MKIFPSLGSHSRIKITAIVLLAIAAVTIPVAASYYQTTQATSQATANGPMSITWGDPYKTPETSQGTASETLTMTGNIASQPNMPGYYTYSTINLSGALHAQWSDANGSYVLDTNFSYSISSYEIQYQEATLNPAVNSFYVSFMHYTAIIQVNGVSTHTSGEAGAKASAPGFFEQPGQARVTTIIIYSPLLGDSQYVIRWSQAAQTIDGTQLPAATQLAQTITTNNSIW